tara:strand:+ start:649 stop:1296 length:648 start_codon:yes stop_codon:yes gene_type:complete
LNKVEIFEIIKNIKGYQTSLKHDSYDKRQKNSKKPFQKYEFLGDRVLGLVISEYLITNFPKSTLDEISRRFIYLVNTSMLAKIFKKHNLIEIFKHQLDPKSIKNSVYADAVESLIGFIYTNKDLNFTKKFIYILWNDELNTLPLKDPKTFIQEYSQKKNKMIPQYKLIDELGTKHKPKFVVELNINDLTVEGEGISKQKAEIAAAKKMIKLIKSK